MYLTRQSEIAFGMLAACARRPHAMASTRQLAETTRTTKDHAAQIVAKLVRAGYLASERGRGGGVRIAADPASIRLGEILRLTQPERSAFDGEAVGDSSSGNAVLLDTIVAAASTSLLRLMERFTVADLLTPAAASRIACIDCSLLVPARQSAAHEHSPFPQSSGSVPGMTIGGTRPDQERSARHVLYRNL